MNKIIFGATTFFLIFLDLFTKSLSQNLSEPLTPFKALPFFTLTQAHNIGIAWSIPIPQPVLLPLVCTLILTILYFALKKVNLNKKLNIAVVSLILAGALGNFYDRLAFGFVRDFISVGWFPVFNLADSYISIGVFLIILLHDKIIEE